MKTLLVAAVVIIVGIFLPWATEWASSDIPNLRVPRMDVAGYQMHQGLISGGLTVLAAILGALAANMTLSGRFAGTSAILAGVVVIMMGVTSLESKNVKMGSGNRSVTGHSRAQIGVPVTIFGGVLLLIGGVLVFRED